MMIASLVVAVLLSMSAHSALKVAETHVDDNKQQAADAVTTAAAADTVVATAADVIRNANLAKAMIDHNDVYPDVYNEILPYIPSFFRINSVTATPNDATTATVTFVGTIGSYQQYADVMLALMRYKNARSISRQGYEYNPTIVPGLTQDDPNAQPRKQGAAPVPDDQIARIAYLQSQPRQDGYLNVGNFGAPGPVSKGAMPGDSLITITMVIAKNLQSPMPRETLAGAGGASAAAAAAPSIGGGLPPSAGGPPPSAGAGPKSKGADNGD